MIVTPNFHMNGNCREAIQFYQKALGAKIISIYSNRDANPQDYQVKPEEKDFIYHAEIMIGNQRIMMTDDLSDFPPKGNTLSLVITFDSIEKVKNAFEGFSNACHIISPMQKTTYSSCFVSLLDKFGMRWEFMTEQAPR